MWKLYHFYVNIVNKAMGNYSSRCPQDEETKAYIERVQLTPHMGQQPFPIFATLTAYCTWPGFYDLILWCFCDTVSH